LSTDMTIAMTVWGNRISPVFDSSNTLLIAKVCQSAVIKRSIESFEPRAQKQMAAILSRFRVDVLICGAITDTQSEIIIKQSIRLVPFISGHVSRILDSYIRKPDKIIDFSMPGAQTEISTRLH